MTLHEPSFVSGGEDGFSSINGALIPNSFYGTFFKLVDLTLATTLCDPCDRPGTYEVTVEWSNFGGVCDVDVEIDAASITFTASGLTGSGFETAANNATILFCDDGDTAITIRGVKVDDVGTCNIIVRLTYVPPPPP